MLNFVIRGEGSNIAMERVDEKGRAMYARPASREELLMYNMLQALHRTNEELSRMHATATVELANQAARNADLERRLALAAAKLEDIAAQIPAERHGGHGGLIGPSDPPLDEEALADYWRRNRQEQR